MKHFHKDKPFECAYCARYYVSGHYYLLVLKGGEEFGICEKCKIDLLCDHCGKKMDPHELTLEECTICERIYLSCEKCKQSKESFPQKIKRLGKELLYRCGLRGLSVFSKTIQCCISGKEKPLKMGVFYLQKNAPEGQDREN